MAKSYQNAKARKSKERFLGIPYRVVNSEKFKSLSPAATKLLIDIRVQYQGNNNGDLTACWAVMRNRGWKSSGSLHKAFCELKRSGMVVVTRQGFKRRGFPTLVALTWESIDDTKNVYDSHVSPSPTPLGFWMDSVQCDAA